MDNEGIYVEATTDEPENPIAPAPYVPQALATAERMCRACGTVNKQGGYRCNNCGRFLPANRERRTTGETARYQPAEILMSADQLLDAIVADKGGANAMTALERSLPAKLRDIDVILTLNKNIIVRAGLGVQEGRRAHDRYLASVDRFIGFSSAGGFIKKVAVTGGPPQTLATGTATVTGATWSRDDVILFSSLASPIQRLPARGSEAPNSVTTFTNTTQQQQPAHSFPYFLPDGKRFLYVVRSSRPTRTAST